MVETHEFRGFWWLPENEEERLSGTLTVKKGDAKLALLGHFGHVLLSDDGTEKTYSLDLEERPRIHGISETGKQITLERHGTASWSGHFPGIQTSVYEPEVVLTESSSPKMRSSVSRRSRSRQATSIPGRSSLASTRRSVARSKPRPASSSPPRPTFSSKRLTTSR